jgi:hypothetical protein
MMKLPSRAEMQRRSDRELAGMMEEIRRDIAACEQQRRKGYAALEDIRRVQVQRRVRPTH